MTVKEAALKFQLTEREVRKRKNDGMVIGATTENRRIVIPNETAIIPSRQDIQNFLFEILKYKNNPNMIFSRKLCPDDTSFEAVIDFLYKKGFIGECKKDKNINDILNNIHLTEEGIRFVIGDSRTNKICNLRITPLTVNVDCKIGLLNIG